MVQVIVCCGGLLAHTLMSTGQYPTFSESPIWLLGQSYECEKSNDAATTPSCKRFLEAFTDLLWFTYRKDFSAIENTTFTSDAGWGCMLRSGQMVLGQALVASLSGGMFLTLCSPSN